MVHHLVCKQEHKYIYIYNYVYIQNDIYIHIKSVYIYDMICK